MPKSLINLGKNSSGVIASLVMMSLKEAVQFTGNKGCSIAEWLGWLP